MYWEGFFMEYNELGKKVYGRVCEFDGCGWDLATCDVHHISYKEQQEYEKLLRHFYKNNDLDSFKMTLYNAKSEGFNHFNSVTLQLTKDDRSTNLCVLCPNHHRYVHHFDIGLDILNYIPERK